MQIRLRIQFLCFFFILCSFLAQPVSAQLRILPLGDSITQGELMIIDENAPPPLYKPNGLRGLRADGAMGVLDEGQGGYRLPLEQMLIEMGWDFQMVGRRTEGGGNHEGYPGYMTSDLLPMLPEILEINHPDFILFHIGTNDLPKPINADSCYKNIKKMLEIIHEFDREITVILAQIIPCLKNTKLGRERYPEIINLNDLLVQIPEEFDFVDLVDMWYPFVETEDWENELMSDSWHPNSRGYYKMAKIWRAELEQLVPGRSPLLTHISPDSGFVFQAALQCKIDGDFFQNGMTIFLESEAEERVPASAVTFRNPNRVLATFNLIEQPTGEWRLWARNPNKMRSIYSSDVYFSILPNQFLFGGSVSDSQAVPIPGVTVTLKSTATTQTTLTDVNGNFEIANMPGLVDYTLSGYKAGFSIRPAQMIFKNVQQNYSQLNFTARPVVLAGFIIDNTGTGVPEVRVSLSGATIDSALTDSTGYFHFVNLTPGQLTVTPQKTHWEFSPLSQTVNLDTTDIRIDFAGIDIVTERNISGTVRDSLGVAVVNLRLQLTGGKILKTKTDENGIYLFAGLPPRLSYKIRSAEPYTVLSPDSIFIPSLETDFVQQDFTVISRKFPPQIVGLKSQQIREGEPFQPIDLKQHIVDPDNPVESVKWTITNTNPLMYSIGSNHICQLHIPHPDWYGQVTALFVATDRTGLADSARVHFQVVNVNDPPRPFSLHADTTVTADATGNYHFTWQKAVDPDSSDGIYYSLVIGSTYSGLYHDPIHVISAQQDTGLTTRLALAAGQYFWGILATDQKSGPQPALNVGTLEIRSTATIESRLSGLPQAFTLRQNYPNPFNPTTTIEFDLPVASQTVLVIFDELGKQVVLLQGGELPAGRYSIKWDGRDQQGKAVSTGHYFCTLKANHFKQTIEMSLIK